VKYRFATKPRPYQKPALKFLLRNRGGGLQVPMRWGKTKVAVDFANAMHLMEGVKRVLVVGPISSLGVWPQQIEEHTPPGFDLDWMVVNYESVYDRLYGKRRQWTPVPSPELHDFDADLVIVDESHNLGNPNAVSSRMTYGLCQQARFRLLMTGTMFHRKPFFVFGQAKLYDPAIFGTSFTAFKHMVAVFGGYGGYEVLRYQNLDWMMDKMKQWVWIEDYVPPGDPVVNELRFELTGPGLRRYLTMEHESILTLRGQTVVSPIVLSRHLRCQMIAGGWLKAESGKYLRAGDDAFRVGQDRLREYAEQGIEKVVIGCRFVPELKDAAVAAQSAGFKPILLHGRVDKDDRVNRIRHFQKINRPAAFVAQLQTAKESIDLSAADTMLFWSLSESFVTHDQFSRRIEKYEDERTLMYDYLIPNGTRTEVTYESLNEKEDVARFIAKDPKRVEMITAKLQEDTREDEDDHRSRGRRHGPWVRRRG
jgi:hypothetical protein